MFVGKLVGEDVEDEKKKINHKKCTQIEDTHRKKKTINLKRSKYVLSCEELEQYYAC